MSLELIILITNITLIASIVAIFLWFRLSFPAIVHNYVTSGGLITNKKQATLYRKVQREFTNHIEEQLPEAMEAFPESFNYAIKNNQTGSIAGMLASLFLPTLAASGASMLGSSPQTSFMASQVASQPTVQQTVAEMAKNIFFNRMASGNQKVPEREAKKQKANKAGRPTYIQSDW